MHKECISCLDRQAKRLFDKYQLPAHVIGDINFKFRLFINDHKKNNLTAPEATRYLHLLFTNATGVTDIYGQEKNKYNNLMLGYEDELRTKINKSDKPFFTALRYALAGNIIDFGPHQSFDIMKALDDAGSRKPAIDDSVMLRDELKSAGTVLYLGDNAGEIVMDKLFIETIHHRNLYFAVRGGNAINDITSEDAAYVGMNKVARVISNGYNAPSTILDRCSKRFLEIYNKADLIISKGQGNFEGLMNERDKDIFFLLMVKCHLIARKTGVQKNDVIVMKNRE
jgi:uncharacterized protein with ATP-grasp and redox domains